MASALPAARAQLKDLKPPISDAEIQDSLWHYWFDVEKSVAWLRKDWEKKGEFECSFPHSPSSHKHKHTAPRIATVGHRWPPLA